MPAAKTARQLKEVLFTTYGGFANKTQKDLEKYSRFIVDDRTDADSGAKGLYPNFCSMFADVIAPDRVSIMLTGGVPQGPSVTQWLEGNGTTSTKILNSHRVVFEVSPANLGSLLSLAQAMASITAPGARYSEKAYKYSVPRTAKSLKRLHEVLCKHWASV